MLWEITASGAYKDLHDFGAGQDGAQPEAGVTFDADGDIFGTTSFGGAYSQGIVWKISTSGTYKDLHDFRADRDGEQPEAGVTLDSAGNMYGTAEEGGAYNGGMVWEITSSGIYKDLHDFGGAGDGVGPSGVTLDADGDIFGTNTFGGEHNGGMEWKITASGTYEDIHDFGGADDGTDPVDNVTFDPAGNMYGTTSGGGAHGGGMVWEITASATYRELHTFGATGDGVDPEVNVTFDSTGNMYGTANGGGAHGGGIVWEISASGTYMDLHDFGVGVGGDGSQPAFNGVTLDPSGDLYGMTQYGGEKGEGTVWELSVPPQLDSLTLKPVSVVGGSPSTGTVMLTGPAPSTGIVVSLSSNSADAKVPSFVTVTAGKTSATFAVTTIATSSNVTVTITAKQGSISKEAGLTIDSPALSSVSVNPATVTGGSSSTGTVTLTGPAPAAGMIVSLSSGSADAKVPSSVTIASGKTSTTFAITTTPTASNVTANITAKLGSVSKAAALTIDAPVLSELSLNPTTVTGGTSSTGTVTLTGPAPSAGLVITLGSSSADAKVPSSVTVASGKSSASFTVTTSKVTSATSVTITAKGGGVTKTVTLKLNP